MNMVRAGILGASLLAIAVASPGASADPDGEAAISAAIATLDQSPQWKASARRIASEGSAVVVEGLSVAAEQGSLSAEVAKAAFADLNHGGGAVTFSSLAVSGVKVRQAGTELTIPSIEASGVSLPDFSAFRFDAATPIVSLARALTLLAAAKFDGVNILEASLQEGPDGARSGVTARGIAIGRMADGVLENPTIGVVSFSDDPSAAATAQLGPVLIKDLSLIALAQVLDPSFYRDGKGDGNWRPALASLEISNFRSGAPRMAIDRIALTGLDVRQAAQPPTTLYDALAALGPGGNEKQVLGLMAERLQDLAGWLKLGTFSVDGFYADPPDGGRIIVAHTGLEELSPDGLARASIEGLEANGPQLTAAAKTIAISKVVWPDAKAVIDMARLGAAGSSGQQPDVSLMTEVAGSVTNVFPYVGEIEIAGIRGGLPGAEPVTLERYLLTNDGGTLIFPAHTKANLEKLVIPGTVLRMTPESKQVFDALGYDRLELGISGEAQHDAASGDYGANFSIVAQQAGTLSLGYAFGGLTEQAVTDFLVASLKLQDHEPNPAELMAAFKDFTFRSVRLRFEDQSLTGRLLPFVAAQQGMDEKTLVANGAAMLQLGLMQLGRPEFAMAAVKTVTDYLANPKSITLTVKPAAPLGMADFMQMQSADPGTVFDTFGISLTAND